MLLIVTNKQDPHADHAIRELNRREISVFRLNTECLLTDYQFTLNLEPNGNIGGLIQDCCGRILKLSTISVAWFRKPSHEFEMKTDCSDKIRAFIISECKAFLDTLYSLPGIRWINDPFCASRSKHKIQQLLLAAKYGVRVPTTIITNNPQDAVNFSNCGFQEFAVKSVYNSAVDLSGVEQSLPTQKISAQQLAHLSSQVALSPSQVQEYVDKSFELRVTIFDDEVYAVKIDSQLNDKTKVDWRPWTSMNPHYKFDLPEKIKKFCVEFLQEQGLLFGAMDFIVTMEGEYVFLENNPFGQYLWLETETGLPLTERMCAMLLRHAEA